jgi:CDP-glucose 4,6-dehydratase
VRLATARAGNVIGGGDRCEDRIIPDCVRALEEGKPIVLRNPDSVRPWQHVLDCLHGYLIFIEQKAVKPFNGKFPVSLNFGPLLGERLTVRELVTLFFDSYGRRAEIRCATPKVSMEAKSLVLDPSKAEAELGWRCLLSQRDAITWTANWYRAASECYGQKQLLRALTASQISDYKERLANVQQDVPMASHIASS